MSNEGKGGEHIAKAIIVVAVIAAAVYTDQWMWVLLLIFVL